MPKTLAKPADPLLDFRFQVEIDGLIFAGFTEVSGLSVEIETETYNEGGVYEYTHILPKSVKYQKIVLKKGVIQDDNEMWNWMQGIMEGVIKPKNISILLLNHDNSTACSWEIDRALPTKWEGSELKGTNGGIFIETLTLDHHGIKKV